VSANVELVRSVVPDEVDLVEVINSPDPVAVFAGGRTGPLAPDVDVLFAPPPSGGPGLAYKGIAGLVEGWRDWLTPWHSYRMSAEEFIDAGANVVVHVGVAARTERHGVEVEHKPSSVWTVENDEIVAVRFFLERDDALRFAGID
jgi:hypothetical protein